MQLGSALAGRADKGNGKPIVIRHGDDGRLSIPRVALESAFLGAAGPLAPPRAPPKPKPPNSMITGTGRVALAGVVNINWMSTTTCGYEELSTWPTTCFVMTGTSPFTSLDVLITSHFTLGVTFGIRP